MLTKHLYKDGIKYMATTATIGEKCNHDNGWYVSVKFWIFSKTVYVCSDCGEVIYD